MSMKGQSKKRIAAEALEDKLDLEAARAALKEKAAHISWTELKKELGLSWKRAPSP